MKRKEASEKVETKEPLETVDEARESSETFDETKELPGEMETKEALDVAINSEDQDDHVEIFLELKMIHK